MQQVVSIEYRRIMKGKKPLRHPEINNLIYTSIIIQVTITMKLITDRI